ncbi:MAG: hypothetical protein JXQ27_07070 [Acidobacteria bacterium]|nr:hypothetical protein [Acidobacteriota bacterium]
MTHDNVPPWPPDLRREIPEVDQLDPHKWHLLGYDTFAREYYLYFLAFDTEMEARLAAEMALWDLEDTQPTQISGGQGERGIQDRVFVIGPGGEFYRIVLDYDGDSS